MSFPHPSHNHAHCTADMLARAEQVCLRNGSKLTEQRRDVLNYVAASHQAIGAYDIIERMAKTGPRPAPMTVYRALDFLQAQGLVHKIESQNAYIACSHAHEGSPAALLICETCGQVAEIASTAIFKQATTQAKALGFTPTQMMFELKGHCQQCASHREA